VQRNFLAKMLPDWSELDAFRWKRGRFYNITRKVGFLLNTIRLLWNT